MLPFVAVLVPTLNEERHVASCLESLLAQEPGGGFEILVLDGGSTDATRERVAAVAATSSIPVRLVENPGRLQAAACNLGATAASERATVLLRADAHAVYPADFLVGCVRALVDQGATSVVVPMVTRAEPDGGGMQRAIVAAQVSKLGTGGAAHRSGGSSGWVDHGHHAAFDRAFFRRLGGYRAELAVNEDAELDHRAHTLGGRVWMCREAPMTYFPRRSLPALARQYRRFGTGRATTSLAYGVTLRPRQLAPLAAVGGCAAGVLVTPRTRLGALVPLSYLGGCCGWGARAAVRARDPWLLAAGPAAVTMHVSWAVGFLAAAPRLLAQRRRKTARPEFPFPPTPL